MALPNRKRLGILLLMLGVLLTLPILFLGQLPLLGITGLLLAVAGLLLACGKEPQNDVWLFP
ncbi:MAG: hypothetical protein HFF18_10815 [Oscillospiraceae bacterium]|nr:hypothetical protein [Oscillospiraceae bacterium]